MARPRLPKARALVEGRHIVHPERHKRRNEPTAGELGDAPEWMSALQAEAWDDFAAEAPWLNFSHRALVEIASVMKYPILIRRNRQQSSHRSAQSCGLINSQIAHTSVFE